MNIKYILNGGFNINNTENNNDEFYLEILKDAPESSSVLLVLFANEYERFVPKKERIASEFKQVTKAQKLSFEIANEQDFISQIKKADIVYFVGGKNIKLLEVLNRFPELVNYLKGKVVAGESAGANVLAKYCYSPNADKAMEGLGLLPIRLIPHYHEKYKGKLDEVGSEFELVLLPEYENRIFITEYSQSK